MKKLLLFVITMFVMISGVNALELDLYSKNAILYNYDLDKVIYEKDADEKVGSVTINYDGNEIKTSGLYLERNMEFSIFRFMTNIILPIGIILIVCILMFKRKSIKKR